MKAMAKRFIGRRFSRDFLEKLTEYSIAEIEPAVSLNKAEKIIPKGDGWDNIILRGREDLWTRTLQRLPCQDILLLEFGVHRGESMSYFLSANTQPQSRFFGFDSFEGLPEVWRGTTTAHFDQGGAIPPIADQRVRFVKGWFKDTLPSLLDELHTLSQSRSLVVHFDADLYSSTLFLLFALNYKFKEYTFIFDEFSGHETRALFNFLQSTGLRANFLYSLDWQGFPQVVSGEMKAS